MSEVNWHRVFAISSLVMALILVSGSIYLHVRQKHHLGRLHYESATKTHTNGAEAAIINMSEYQYDEFSATTENDYSYSFDYEYKNVFESDEYSSEESAEAYNSSIKLQQFFEEFSLKLGVQEIFNNDNVINESFPSLAAQQTSKNEMHPVEQLVEEVHTELEKSTVSEVCLQCMCEVTTECQAATCGVNKQPCGIFRISLPYWIDAGKPQLEGDLSAVNDGDGGYSHCVNNVYCAARTVKTFIKKYSVDCNMDGLIDCRDYIAMHIQGASGCLQNEMMPIFKNRLHRCLSKYGL